LDDRLAVLTQSRLHVLDGIGPELWRSADGCSIEGLTDRLRARMGEPPAGVEPMQAVEDAIVAMTAAGLLQRA
ncbi:MAG: hypothetical protein ABI255_02460, partial [Microbacteriaceae bacterium]